VFVEFGAATQDGARLEMTPLGRWALLVLLDSLAGVALSSGERASLTWPGSKRTPRRTSLR